MNKLIASAFFLSTLALAATPEVNKIMGAKIYDIKDQAKMLYTMKRSDLEAGPMHTITTVYTNMEGQVDVVEQSIGENLQFKKYIIDQKQLDAHGEIEVKGSEVHFTYTKKGKTKTAVEKLKDNFVVPPTIVSYVQKNWSRIAAGETVEVRFGVADRQETVGFEFKKTAEEDFLGKKVWAVRMKPSSFIIAALVNPLRFYFEPDGARLIKIEGRVPPKRKSGNAFKDLDALSVYEY